MLAQFLRDDGGGSIGIKETMTNHLTNHLVGAAIVGFWAALLALQGCRAVLEVLLPELKVALFAESILPRGLQGPKFTALALDKHRQPLGDLIAIGNRQGSVRANESCSRKVHGEHRILLLLGSSLGGNNSLRSDISLLKYDVIVSRSFCGTIHLEE